MKRLLNLFAARKSPPPAEFLACAPLRLTYVVGDIHGMAALLERLLAKIETNRAAAPADLVFVGDYIDRGPESAAVLARVFELVQNSPMPVTCLLGNHERMMLDFLDDPARYGPRWLHNGGQETLQSYGISSTARHGAGDPLQARAKALRSALPDGIEAWLRTLPRLWQSGPLAVVHAAADPALPLDQQDPDSLIWGHRDFLTKTRRDGIWLAHGHTVVETAHVSNGRISLDTGAYRTGQLTAARIEAGEISFLQG